MKLFERVIEQRLHSYLDDIGFVNKYLSGFRQNKPADNHLLRLSQSVMESFSRERTCSGSVAAFVDVEKLSAVFDTMDPDVKFSCLTFPSK